MSITTIPLFYYVAPITSSNNFLNFREPNAVLTTEKTAVLQVGARTPTDLATEIERGLNDTGENTYTATFDRDTRLITISADDTFELLVSSGSNIGLGVFSLIGFTGADRTGASSYIGNATTGSQYKPQFLPQRYLDFENNIGRIQATVNESTSGTIETVTFGSRAFMEMNLRYITSEPKGKDNPITNNPTGREDANAFLDFATQKREMEFMKDNSNTASFDKVLLESTPESRIGTDYRLKEQISQGFSEHYETGNLTFRRID